MAPNVLTGLPLSLSSIVQATRPKDSYPDIVAWAEAKHRVVDGDKISLIELQPVQKAVLRYMFQRGPDGNLLFRTMVYSTIKKAGKTEIGGIVIRYAAEEMDKYGEHYCLEALTPVLLADGKRKRIHEMVKERHPGPVLSFNEQTGQVESKAVTGWYKSQVGGRGWVWISYESARFNGVGKQYGFWATGDHPVLTRDGWLPANQIQTGTPLVTTHRSPNQRQYEFLVGSLLGDGCLAKTRHSQNSWPTLRLGHCPAQWEWLDIKKKAIEGFGTKDAYYRDNNGFGALSWQSDAQPAFEQLYQDWYGQHTKKHLNREWVERYFSPLSLAIWYLDDGSKGKGRDGGLLCTMGFSEEDVHWLVELLNKWGIASNFRKTQSGPAVYVRAGGLRYLSQIVGAYTPDCLRYKLCDDAPAFEPHLWELGDSLPFIDRAVVGGKVPPRTTTVYCLDVEDSHNFMANGIVVHNCVANDRDQAMERTYSAVRRSYELTPGYDRKNRMLPGIARVTDVEAKILSNNSVIRTVSLDAKGEAGANPVCSVWSEVWGFDNKPAMLLWDELTPALTRKNSFRFVESYAGIDPDSELLLRLYNQGVNAGRQVDAGELWAVSGEDINVFAECHDPNDPVPIWVNDEAALVVYWDTGVLARRMPWQIGERAEAYYRTEAESLTPESFRRVHLNEWVGATSAFVDASWWSACANPSIPPLKYGSATPELVVAVDGAVSGDCTALVAVSRHPTAPNEVVVRYFKAWTPPVGGKLDYELTIAPELRRLCREYNVLNVVYDPYQMHDLMTQMQKEGFSRFIEFNQGKQRMEADKGLYDLIKGRRVHFNPDPAMGGDVLTQHIHNSASKQGKQEDTKLRLIKKSEKLKIDGSVTLSMACYECLRLYLDPTGESWAGR